MPSPPRTKPDFVTVGQTVKKGDVLFIVESMKLMNEIQSEYSTATVRGNSASKTARWWNTASPS